MARDVHDSHPNLKVCTKDIYVRPNEPFSTFDSTVARRNEDIIAVIQQESSLSQDLETSRIYFRGGQIGEISLSVEGQYQCVWKDRTGAYLIIKSCERRGGKHSEIGLLQLLDGENSIPVAFVDNERVILHQNGQALRSDTHFDIYLIFSLWIAMNQANVN
jgi:hypothetical protein